MKRQALYSCLTCIPEAKDDPTKAAGVCLACSYHCHDGHELIELYTKRNFRCDCGNSKFSGRSCNLCSIKDDINELNKYNQNFSGLYCTCSRPYPDSEDTVQDEMIQCVICEDWFHSRHLEEDLLDYNYAEMTCQDCVAKHDFLLNYEGLMISKVTSVSAESNSISIETITADLTDDIAEIQEVDPLDIAGSSQDMIDTDDSNNECKRPKTKSEVSAKFWLDINWRQQICSCTTCLKMYGDQNILFLLDPLDTVQSYEAKGLAKVDEYQQQGKEMEMKLLGSLPRIPLMETIAAYNDLKENLREYLKKFADNKKVVREEDIKEFFAEMDAKKKQKTDFGYYCR